MSSLFKHFSNKLELRRWSTGSTCIRQNFTSGCHLTSILKVHKMFIVNGLAIIIKGQLQTAVRKSYVIGPVVSLIFPWLNRIEKKRLERLKLWNEQGSWAENGVSLTKPVLGDMSWEPLDFYSLINLNLYFLLWLILSWFHVSHVSPVSSGYGNPCESCNQWVGVQHMDQQIAYVGRLGWSGFLIWHVPRS